MALDLHMLSSLQRVGPILLRHLDAYLELAGQDWEKTKLNAKRKAQLLGVLAVSGWFSLLMICTLIVALTWDTPNRVLAIGIMAAIFVAITVGSAVYIARGQDKPMANLRREWHADRDLMREYLHDTQPIPMQHPDVSTASTPNYSSTNSNATQSANVNSSRDDGRRSQARPEARPNGAADTSLGARQTSPTSSASSMRPPNASPLTH